MNIWLLRIALLISLFGNIMSVLALQASTKVLRETTATLRECAALADHRASSMVAQR